LRDFVTPGNVARGTAEGFYPEYDIDFDYSKVSDAPEPVMLPHHGGAAAGATPAVGYTPQTVGPPLVTVEPNPTYA
jgi:hypothetical protein